MCWACLLGHMKLTTTFVAQHLVGGLVGLTFGMLMETILLVIRTNAPYELPSKRKSRTPSEGQPHPPKVAQQGSASTPEAIDRDQREPKKDR